MEDIIDLIPSTIKKISPQALLDLDEHDRQNIASLRFELPTFGCSGFGRFVAKLKHPTYSVEVENGEEE